MKYIILQSTNLIFSVSAVWCQCARNIVFLVGCVVVVVLYSDFSIVNGFSIIPTTVSSLQFKNFRNGPYQQQQQQQQRQQNGSHCLMQLQMSSEDDDNNDKSNNNNKMEYKNFATKFLSNFMSKESSSVDNNDTNDSNILSNNESTSINTIQNDIDENKPKFPIYDINTMATVLDYELYNSEWFVTGNVQTQYFSNNFIFNDPDVKVNGIKEYSIGVQKIFDQTVSHADIISTIPNPTLGDNVITCTWRLSGKVSIGPTGINIKPYIIDTDFVVDTTEGLIISQVDRFSIPSWDILLSSFLPFLIGTITSPPAPPVPKRTIPKPTILLQTQQQQ